MALTRAYPMKAQHGVYVTHHKQPPTFGLTTRRTSDVQRWGLMWSSCR